MLCGLRIKRADKEVDKKVDEIELDQLTGRSYLLLGLLVCSDFVPFHLEILSHASTTWSLLEQRHITESARDTQHVSACISIY